MAQRELMNMAFAAAANADFYGFPETARCLRQVAVDAMYQGFDEILNSKQEQPVRLLNPQEFLH